MRTGQNSPENRYRISLAKLARVAGGAVLLVLGANILHVSETVADTPVVIGSIAIGGALALGGATVLVGPDTTPRQS